MPADELARYKPLFLQTAWDYLRQMEASLILLSHEPNNRQAIDTVHLCAHSLKSQCAVMQYPELSGICKRIESDFRSLKDDSNALSGDEIKKFLIVLNGIKESLSLISANNIEKKMTEERQQLGMESGGGTEL